ncbi:MAG: cation transport regulator [Candidatus Pacebacteria bacterium]|nr:cation transport regulator [Candidatus Paceibacterota bacterium]
MPYTSKKNLPKGVKDNLPPKAQEIYREAFNSAWHQYKSANKRKAGASREETAHRVAWAAVKDKYHKNNTDEWVLTR